MARWPGVEAESPSRHQPQVELVAGEKTGNELAEIVVPDDSPAAGQRVMELGLPSGTLIVLLSRNEVNVLPGGGTVIEAGDRLVIFADKDELVGIRGMISPAHRAAG